MNDPYVALKESDFEGLSGDAVSRLRDELYTEYHTLVKSMFNDFYSAIVALSELRHLLRDTEHAQHITDFTKSLEFQHFVVDNDLRYFGSYVRLGMNGCLYVYYKPGVEKHDELAVRLYDHKGLGLPGFYKPVFDTRNGLFVPGPWLEDLQEARDKAYGFAAKMRDALRAIESKHKDTIRQDIINTLLLDKRTDSL